MEGWKSWKRAENSFLAAWYQRVRESYVAAWFFGVFQTSRMSTSTATGGGGGGGGVGGALTLMGCVREASPPPQNHHHHHHHHQQHQQQLHRNLGLAEFSAQSSVDPLPKEPKKRRFHPLRGLRKIFRRKSRGAADSRIVSNHVDKDTEITRLPREDITDRHPAGRPEEGRSRSASELLTDSCDRESVFLRRPGMEESFVKLRGGSGKLSVSHDSVFPGEVPHTRPLSSLASLTTLENRFAGPEKQERSGDENQAKNSRSPKDTTDRVAHVAKEDLPQLESASLNHTAAHHRISVRPKNRRPPRRAAPQVANTPTSTITTIAEDSLDSLDPLPAGTSSVASSPTESKNVSVARKSSSRLSRTSDIFEELESKLPRKPSSSVASLSPDSLDNLNASRTSVETNEEQPEVRSVARKSSNRIPKGSELFEELEANLPRRRSSNRLSKSPDSLEATSCWFSKSSEGFDKLTEYEESKPVIRRLLNPISKSTDRVSKSSDSLEAIEVLTSDESIERRRSSFEFRARRTSKNISKSSENFEILEQAKTGTDTTTAQELQKRSSISDINLARGRRLSKSISKSSESFEMIEVSETKDVEENRDFGKCCRRSSKRMSSESSDNLELDDRLENRRIRRTPKRIPSTSFVDIVPVDDQEEEKRPMPVRKPSRLQKSSESSELGSTDTLDSERRNKSSESTETLDSLERDLDQERKQEELADGVLDKREKNDSWANKNTMSPDSEQISAADGTEDSKSLISPDKFYWRQTSESKENIDIHQLLAITIVTRMADNGNNQRSSVIYPKKKQITSSQPTSPIAKQEDNKMIFDNLLVSKNDEDLQNMLNGNISEVSTDTKSFKEKLIMFEKLGK
ncbi:uncharacterized protein LOC128887771 isoform X4 [Hylaeus anthracinus]|uniref:uncharacterized protein LOC128887771 isoform X4 n=1 Tax=Hylaeus anthracinus TaxID=313031 RepID=UPI0023B939B8|nr:uncharacterized protein LOC128887771 isoform X4 [Hylaeus anthracinus]